MRKNISMRFLSQREEWVFSQPRLKLSKLKTTDPSGCLAERDQPVS